MKSLVWLRNDLRMDDNPSLQKACASSNEVHCIYIYSLEQIKIHNGANCKVEFIINNLKSLNKSLKEAHRVLKPGGRFFCLEFSKVENEILNKVYKQYSKIIPSIGKIIVGNRMPYEYLIESIDKFYDQKDLLKKIEKNGFSHVKYRNLTNGIAAIHTGWKI